ncbi:MAG: right-handed parallel beta-helix repeat-containing protein, partial [Prolixibacteraceae bacterium]|nr:right-handed parallel beta-helix repeat-containing protein [Prolixibacteraceae bacterium]
MKYLLSDFVKKAFFIMPFIFLLNQVYAQPSGGPYGPVNMSYNIPTDAVNVYYVSPDGKAENDGKELTKPTSLEEAIKKVVNGDVIVLRGGTYRTGDLLLNQGITMQPYKDEIPIIKGTYIAESWRDMRNGLWFAEWEYLFPSAPADWWHYDHNIKETPLHRFNDDMVFVDGKFLQSTGMESMVDENTFYIDYERKRVYIGLDPTDKLVEITAFDNALIRTTKECHGKKSDGIGPKIKGITFTQYAYRAIEVEGYEPEGISAEKDHGKDVVGSLFENCTISFCSRVAGYFRGDKTIFRNCKISDTSTEGIYILASNDVLLERNIFARNNIENITGYFPAAVKIFNQCYRTTCNDNLVIDHPNSNGIWYDVGNVDGVFINNWVQNVGIINYDIATNRLWPSQNGFFF